MAELRRLYDAAPLRLGPFKVLPELFLNNVGVDDNVYGTTDNPIRDFTFTAGGGGTFHLRVTNRFLISVRESPRYVYYDEAENLRGWNNVFTGHEYVALSRFLLKFTESAATTLERVSTEADTPVERRDNTFEASISWKTTPRTSVQVRGGVTDSQYPDEVINGINYDTLSRREKRISGTFYYQLFPKTKWLVEGEGISYDFASTESGRNTPSSGVYTGFEFEPDATLSGKIRIGRRSFKPEDPTAKPFAGLAGEASVSYRFLGRFVARGSYARDPYFSVWGEDVYYVGTQKGGGLGAYVRRQLRFDYDYSSGNNSYSADPTSASRDDTFITHRLQATYRVWRRWDVGAIVSRWSRDSNVPGESDNRTVWGINLRYNMKPE